jgi:acyl-CoA reductase-like NAD-dependent aldehyde dehydrogenase
MVCALVEEYDLYADGRWVTPEAGRYDDVSPSPESVLATAPDANARCLEQLGNALPGRLDDFFALSQQEWGCIAIANDSQYGLAGAVWGTDVDRALGIARRVRTGQMTVNGCGPGDAPFGGFNQSGFGREGGLPGLHHYTEMKAIGVPS